MQWKNLIDQNQLKKFMQVGIDVKCMHAEFSGCGFLNFGDIATFQKMAKFPFRTMDYSGLFGNQDNLPFGVHHSVPKMRERERERGKGALETPGFTEMRL